MVSFVRSSSVRGRKRAGQLRDVIRIERPARTQRADGGYDNASPTVVGTYSCSIQPVSGRETEQASRLVGADTYAITIRRNDAITVDDTAVWASTGGDEIRLNITEIRLPDPRAQMQMLIAKRNVTE